MSYKADIAVLLMLLIFFFFSNIWDGHVVFDLVSNCTNYLASSNLHGSIFPLLQCSCTVIGTSDLCFELRLNSNDVYWLYVLACLALSNQVDIYLWTEELPWGLFKTTMLSKEQKKFASDFHDFGHGDVPY